MIAVVPDLEFRDGVIELDVSGAPSKDADPTTRGFIGILFRIQKGGPAELIYLRPSNTRADDQPGSQPLGAIQSSGMRRRKRIGEPQVRWEGSR